MFRLLDTSAARSTSTSEKLPACPACRSLLTDALRYVFKAPDRVNVELNEIHAYLSGRLLSCSEAVWRILGLRLHQEWPSVERLDLHLPKDNFVVFNPLDDEDAIEEQLPRATSKLLQWFELNRVDPEARQWRYLDIPEHYVWDVQSHLWRRRVRHVTKVSRLNVVSIHNIELSALRMILHYATGCTSFVDLMTLNGHTCTYVWFFSRYGRCSRFAGGRR